MNSECRQKEDNNRIGKTRDVFRKIRKIKGTFQLGNQCHKKQAWSGINNGT